MRLTMKRRDEMGEAILLGNDDGLSEKNRTIQDAINKLADYEDAEDLARGQVVTKAQREYIDAIVEAIMESDKPEGKIRYACELAGAWTMLAMEWDAK